MTDRRICWTARGIIALNWLAIALALALPGVSRDRALFAFGVFRTCAILGFGYLFYEVTLVLRKRATAGATIVDGLLVLSMFLFWFLVLAATL